jgi:endonuclease YncB( thermonuclease family)
MKRIACAFPIASLLIPVCIFAADLTGPVVSILDGDTIEVLHNNHAERIRLSGIDCPEKGQAYGNNAKHAASELAFGKLVTVQTYGHDKYDRTLGDVILPDGMNLNQELVTQGWCWWYRKYAPGDRCWKGWRRTHERQRKVYGSIRHLSHRGFIAKRGGGNHSTCRTWYR